MWPRKRATNSPERDEIPIVDKGHNALRIVLRDREQGLQDAHHPLAEARAESVEDEMRILLANRRVGMARHVVAQRDVMEGHGQCRAVWEVRDDECIWHAAVFVNDEKVGNVLRKACLDEGFGGGGSSVEPERIGEDEAEFLGISESLWADPFGGDVLWRIGEGVMRVSERW